MEKQREIKLAETESKREPYNLSRDVQETYRQTENTRWQKQWDEILYPDWT